MRHAVVQARDRLALVCTSLVSARALATKRTMPSPKIRNIGPLPPEEAKWTELRKIEVQFLHEQTEVL